MKRVIVSLEKLTPEIFDLVSETYPTGYRNRDVITFPNAKGQFIRAIEVRTEDVIYLVKISAIEERERELEEDGMDVVDNDTSDEHMDDDFVDLDEIADED